MRITSQKELDDLNLKSIDEIVIDATEFICISKQYPVPIYIKGKSIVSVYGNATVKYVSGNATVKYVYDNATVKYVYGNATVEYVYDNATVKSVSDNATVEYVSGNATVEYVSDNATVEYVYGNATVKSVSGNATVEYVYDNATVKSVYGNATVKSVYGNATVEYVYGNATVKSVSDNATVRIFNKGVKVNRVSQEAVLICIDCKPQIKKTSKTAHIIKSKKVLHDIDSLRDIFDLQTKKGKIHLYKSVQTDNTDFYSGKIKYKGNVICPDWDEDPNRQCGGGLHLSPTPELALSYHQGKILECEVDIKDLIVYPYDISKVRCKKVKVLGESK